MVDVCPDCDLLQRLPQHRPGYRVCCARCDHVFANSSPTDAPRDAAIALTSLILLAVANAFPILTFELEGRHQQATVFDGVQSMWSEQRYELACLILAVAIVIPIAHAVSVLGRSYLMGRPQRRTAARSWALWSARLAPWGMTEVYLLGALVAFVKLDELASVVVGPALYAFALMSVLTAWSATHAGGVWAALRSESSW